jgi:hypothetical protein
MAKSSVMAAAIRRILRRAAAGHQRHRSMNRGVRHPLRPACCDRAGRKLHFRASHDNLLPPTTTCGLPKTTRSLPRPRERPETPCPGLLLRRVAA